LRKGGRGGVHARRTRREATAGGGKKLVAEESALIAPKRDRGTDVQTKKERIERASRAGDGVKRGKKEKQVDLVKRVLVDTGQSPANTVVRTGWREKSLPADLTPKN